MTNYTVVESHTDRKGTIVTFAHPRRRGLLAWLLSRPAGSVTYQARTDGISWWWFPSMHQVSIETEMALEAAWERHKLLEKYSA